MQLRMLHRRSLGGSMTIVGDIAQATGTWAPASWGEVVAHLPGERSWRQVDLTVNYRTPTEIMELARRVLAAAEPGMVAPEAVRDSGEPVRWVRASGPASTGGGPPGVQGPAQASLFDVDTVAAASHDAGDDPAQELGLVDAVTVVAAAELEALAGGPGGDGRLAVIAPPSLLDALSDGLRAAGIDAGTGYGAELDRPATLLAVEEAKGLEFDSVMVVEPSRLADESAQGLRAVYVALTRATRRLAVVHAEELPECLQPEAAAHGRTAPVGD
jgi:hypothetical protein